LKARSGDDGPYSHRVRSGLAPHGVGTMSGGKTIDRVGRVLAMIKREYTALSEGEQMDLDSLLLEAEWFGISIKVELYAKDATIQIEKAKASHRSRKANSEIQKRNDRLLAERESTSPPKSYEELARQDRMNAQTVRSGIKEARKRRSMKRLKEAAAESLKRRNKDGQGGV